jgi:uncharacterized membrane protein YhaH (DUF805 family)
MDKANIFINYRRSESAAAAGRLYDRLLGHFAPDDLFIDVDAIAPGSDFVQALNDRVSRCNIFLAVINPDWARTGDGHGRPRLHDPNDYVRVEIEAALARNIPVIPVLVDGAEMPKAEDLPDSLKPLTRRQAVPISHHRFGAETDDLAAAIAKTVGVPLKTAAQVRLMDGGAADRNPRTLSEILFSFEGRLARKPYWKGTALYIFGVLLMGVLAGMFIAATVLETESNPSAAASKLQSELDMQNWRARFIVLLVSLPFYWPYLALTKKRFHDLNFGWKVFGPFLACSLASAAFFATGHIGQEAHNMLTVAFLTVMVFLGLVEGTRGGNAFGPDPREDAARQPAAA